jgi:hypothetical protein
MAGTTFSDIYDKFMVLVNDYRLVSLFETSPVDFETYLQGWLDNAILEFYNCDQSLSYTTTTFTASLSTKNQLILARIMVKYWLSKEVQDVTEMRLHIQDGDFKTYSEAQNLQAKSAHLDKVKEDVSQILVDYSLNNNELWASWYNGIYFTP